MADVCMRLTHAKDEQIIIILIDGVYICIVTILDDRHFVPLVRAQRTHLSLQGFNRPWPKSFTTILCLGVWQFPLRCNVAIQQDLGVVGRPRYGNLLANAPDSSAWLLKAKHPL
jgi:hypothetical protein